MHNFLTTNTNTMSRNVYRAAGSEGLTIPVDTRTGQVYAFTSPVALTYTRPWERVNLCPVRDANPFFHFFESLAILDGYNNVDYIAQFLPGMRQYSDDGKTFHGFYGERLRAYPPHGWDQLASIIQLLEKNPEDRRAIVSLWDPNSDLEKDSVDVPCNDMLMFRLVSGALELLVCNRSNDLVWGNVSGANPVQFSFIQEYVAAALGRPMGRLMFIINNAHFYPETSYALFAHYASAPWWDPYVAHGWHHHALFQCPKKRHNFDRQLRLFVREDGALDDDPLPFFSQVALPMFNVFRAHVRRERYTALTQTNHIAAPDWRTAVKRWLGRRRWMISAEDETPWLSGPAHVERIDGDEG